MKLNRLLIIPLILMFFTNINAAEQEFKIGVMLCLTGDCAEWGNNSLQGIRLAVKELNAQGGILGRKVSIVLEDTREGAGGANAISAYQNLILDPEIQYIIGPTWSIGGAPLAPIVAKNTNVIITSPSLGIADFNEAGKHIFNLWPHDSYSTEKLASYAVAQGWKKGVIFEANDPWGVVQANTFEKKFKELGGEIIKKISNAPDASSFRGEALAAKQSKAEFVFQANLYKISQYAKDLQRISYQGRQITILIDDTRLKEAQGALEGLIYAKYPDPTGEFYKKYELEYQQKPGVTADTAYDAVKLYAHSIVKAKSFDLQLVQAEILNSQEEGASGKILFDSNGGVIKEPLIYQIAEGKEVPIP